MYARAGADGPFSVSLWFRGNGTDTSGELFEYIFSHSAYATRTLPSPVSSFQANQARLSRALLVLPSRCAVLSCCVQGGYEGRDGGAPLLVSRGSSLVRRGCARGASSFKAAHGA